MSLEIYKRGNIWWCRGSVGGKYIRESTRLDREKDAERYTAEREARLAKEAVYGDEIETTFADACFRYLEDGGDTRFLTPILDALRSSRLATIKPGMLRSLAKKIYPDAAPATWNRQVLSPARAVINHAADLGWCAHIRVKQFSSSKPLKQAVDRHYIDRFREHCELPHLRALMLFNYQTAARISEAVSLTPEHFDLDTNRAFIERTKNDDPRIFYLSDEMTAELRLLKPRRVRNGSTRMFGYQSRHAVYGTIKRVCKRADIPYLATHQPGRHSFATEMLVRQRVDIVTTAKIGNWKSTRLLLESYAHAEDMKGVVEDVFGAKTVHSSYSPKRNSLKVVK